MPVNFPPAAFAASPPPPPPPYRLWDPTWRLRILGVQESWDNPRGDPLQGMEGRAEERNLLQMAPEPELACLCPARGS